MLALPLLLGLLGAVMVTSMPSQPAANLSLHARATEVYASLTPCLLDNPIREGRALSLRFPSDAMEHYSALLKATEKYRLYPHHAFGGYRGPWIESLFIKHFIGRPLESFSGLFPIFVQWIENDHATRNLHNPLFDDLRRLLRKDVIYVLVSQANQGIFQLIDEFPNILMLSAGGFGHIPLPLIKGELSKTDLPQFFSIDIGFFGDTTHGGRTEIFTELDKFTSDFIVRKGKSSRWIEDMGKTKFNLAPAGFGPTSFRLAEIIQLERVPVYIYNDRWWLPYEGTEIAADKIGYVGSVNDMNRLVQTLRSSTDRAILEKIELVRAARRYYTYEGLLEQMEMFFEDPLNMTGVGGYLRCARVPLLHTWRFWWDNIKRQFLGFKK